jgi:hypothetical protein
MTLVERKLDYGILRKVRLRVGDIDRSSALSIELRVLKPERDDLRLFAVRHYARA